MKISEAQRRSLQAQVGVESVGTILGPSCVIAYDAQEADESSQYRQNFPKPGLPIVAQWLTNLTRNHEVAGSVPALAQWVNDPALP